MAKAPTAKLFTGAEMPVIGLGTWKSAVGDVHKAVVAAIESGYRHIDCAAAYGNEHEVGSALADVFARGIVKREELFITSKLWVAASHVEDVAAALTKTLSDLKIDYLDLYLVHWPFFYQRGAAFPAGEDKSTVLGYDPAKYLAIWRELEKEVDAGRVRHIGCSNMSSKKLADLMASARIQPAVDQVEGHPFLAQKKLKAFCDAHKILLTAYSPLGSPDRPARLMEETDPKPLYDETIIALAAAKGVEPAQILIRWAVQRGTIVIPKSVTPARIAKNIDVFGFELSAADMEAIDKLDSGRRLIKGFPFMTAANKHWSELWDGDSDVPAAVAAVTAGGAGAE